MVHGVMGFKVFSLPGVKKKAKQTKTEMLEQPLEDNWQHPPKPSSPYLATSDSTWHTANTSKDTCQDVLYVGWEESKTGGPRAPLWRWINRGGSYKWEQWEQTVSLHTGAGTTALRRAVGCMRSQTRARAVSFHLYKVPNRQ